MLANPVRGARMTLSHRRNGMKIEYLHTMVRVKDLEKSLEFYRMLGLEERRRSENEGGRFTLV